MNDEGTAPPQPGERRLAAICFTDVVGYSARMQGDETDTLNRVRSDFERMGALCAHHGGEVLKSMGDGLLLCFSSAVQAVACALKIQEEFASRPPGFLQHRIGIHLGDIFRDRGDVAGDGVNIAARLETKARPGTICLSQSVYEAVKGKLPMRVEALGPQRFKNISDPVTVYLVTSGAPLPPAPRLGRRTRLLLAVCAAAAAGVLVIVFRPRAAPSADASTGRQTPAKAVEGKSIAVLPFANMSDDKENEYVAEGIHEDLLTDLANIASLRVISRTSVMQYRATTKPIGQIALELGVSYVLEGSVRRAGNRVRVTGQLIRAATDEHVWAKSYDGDLADVFALQARLASTIAEQLSAVITGSEEKRIGSVSLANPEAYELYLRARNLRRSESDLGSSSKEAEALLRRATALDSSFALAWAGLADVLTDEYFDDQSRAALRDEARADLDRALALAPERAEIQVALGRYYYFCFKDFESAAARFSKALELEPGDANAHMLLGLLARRLGQWRASDMELRKAYELDPLNALLLRVMTTTYKMVRDYDRAQQTRTAFVKVRGEDPGLDVEIAILQARASMNPGRLRDWFNGTPEAFRSGPDGDRAAATIAVWSGDASGFLASSARLRADPTDEEATILNAIAARKLGRDSRPELQNLRTAIEGIVKADPEAYGEWESLARVCALLGLREEAEQAVASAAKSIPRRGDAVDESWLGVVSAQVAMWLGDTDRAIAEVDRIVREGGSPDVDAYAVSHLLYWWPIQADPRVQAMSADPALRKPIY